MGKFAEMMGATYSENGSYDKMIDTVVVIDQLMEKLHKHHPEMYKETMHEVESIVYAISKEDAEKIVRNMSPKGQVWSYDEVKTFVHSKGVTSGCVHWYLVMNMVYNDYYNTARAYGLQNDEEFYYSLAKDFIEDPDARPMKVEKYFS